MHKIPTNINQAAIRTLHLLVGKPPQTMAELTKAAGITRTAVSEHLRELMKNKLVDQKVERLEGRGRPRYRYEITRCASVLLASNHFGTLEKNLWQAIENVGGSDLTQKIVEELANLISDQYRKAIPESDPQERFKKFARQLRTEGALIEMEKGSNHLRMHKRNCHLARFYNDGSQICLIDNLVMQQVIDPSVCRIACRHEGDPCCIYELPL